mmetsp:Transcript_25682/g.74286  ORF Transcript_25682/g.74286 Transcript_25682/m.74286 type:complete len:104 (+) Transcript_25682:76-387(+)
MFGGTDGGPIHLDTRAANLLGGRQRLGLFTLLVVAAFSYLLARQLVPEVRQHVSTSCAFISPRSEQFSVCLSMAYRRGSHHILVHGSLCERISDMKRDQSTQI